MTKVTSPIPTDLVAKFRSFVSHATGGRTTDINLPLNTLSVMATQKVNDAWNMALEKGRAEAATGVEHLQSQLSTAPNPCAKIFDHKWLDPVCVEDGCCSLTLGNALKAYVKAQRQMLEKWSECDEAKRNELWRALHACEDDARDALERWGR